MNNVGFENIKIYRRGDASRIRIHSVKPGITAKEIKSQTTVKDTNNFVNHLRKYPDLYTVLSVDYTEGFSGLRAIVTYEVSDKVLG